jgi:ATP-dependent Clp protease adaptor protein ClpS
MAESQSTPTQTPNKPRPQPSKKPSRGELPPYHVVLLNDDDHTYEYVIEMLQSLFAHGEQHAYLLARTVDQADRAIVCTTHKERAELKRDQILAYGCDFRLPTCSSSMRALIEPAAE